MERFWKKCKILGDNECWEWQAAKDEWGYGRFGINGKNRHAHRIAYMLALGHIPDGMKVLHRCDNPPCCNPRHLFLGTSADNVSDMMQKGRHARLRGERNSRARLTRSDVDEIRGSTTPAKLLAAKYGVVPHYIRELRRGKTAWR